MKKRFVLILLLAAIYAGYRYYGYEPAPAPAEEHLAEPGVYFLLDYYANRTEHGIVGWTPGQQVKAVPLTNNPPGRVLVTDGQTQAELERARLTQDIDLAAKLRANDSAAQTRANHDIAAAKAKADADKRRNEAMTARDLEALRVRGHGGQPLPTASPAPSTP